MSGQGPDPSPFGQADAASYDADLERGIALSGEHKDYFARGRLDWLEMRLGALGAPRPRRVLDYGCGTGETTLELARRFPEALVAVVDPSASLVAASRRLGGRCEFHGLGEMPEEASRYDLVYCNGVFHHVPVAERAAALEWIGGRMVSGGYFALWENNAWHPGARWVMKRIPFDRDAVPVTPREAARMVRRAGFEIASIDYAFVFPRLLKALRPAERYLIKLPLGAQYQVLCRKR